MRQRFIVNDMSCLSSAMTIARDGLECWVVVSDVKRGSFFKGWEVGGRRSNKSRAL